MPAITKTDIKAIAEVTVTETTLNGATDTLTFTPGVAQYLILRNATAGALTPNIDGDGATSRYLQGVGSVSTAAGYTFGSIAAGEVVAIDLRMIDAYLSGTIAITGGTGLVASILEA